MISRRTLFGTVGILAAGGAGVAVARLPPPPAGGRPGAPRWLVEAAAREHALLAGLDAALVDEPADTPLTAIRADHAAHAHTLDAALSGYPGQMTSASGSAPARPTRAQLRDSERAAARAATAASEGLTGAEAALLASLAACESTHAELLR